MAVLHFSLIITSTVNKVNGSTESGPSTNLETTVRSLEAFNSVRKIMEDAVDELHRKSFSSRVRHGFLKNFSEIYVDPPWGETKLSITYHLNAHAYGTDDEGNVMDKDFHQDFTRPL